MFKQEIGDWKEYREYPNSIEVDLHHSEFGRREISYEEAMRNVWEETLSALQSAYEKGLSYVIFTHGRFTSRPGRTTARSQVRKLMRSKDTTPYIIKKECIQHPSVFVAAIRPVPS